MSKTRLAALLVSAFVLIAPAANAAVGEDSARVLKLLSQAKGESVYLRQDAAEMESLAGPDVSWRADVDAVDRIKVDVNLLGQQLAQSLPSVARR